MCKCNCENSDLTLLEDVLDKYASVKGKVAVFTITFTHTSSPLFYSFI